MPGDVCRGVVYLRRPMVVREGQRFFVKEANITTVTGLVTKVWGGGGGGVNRGEITKVRDQ